MNVILTDGRTIKSNLVAPDPPDDVNEAAGVLRGLVQCPVVMLLDDYGTWYIIPTDRIVMVVAEPEDE
jgi:hypothetical protein